MGLNRYKKKYQVKALEDRTREIFTRKKNYKHQNKNRWSKFNTEGNKYY